MLIEGIKEQQNTIEELNAKIAELEQAIAEIKAAMNGENAQPQPKLEGRGSSNQMNLHPNPTTGKTNVDYVIKGAFQSAKVEVYNSIGQLLGEYSVNAEGIGNVEIDTSAWAGGTYFCKLIVDNSVQDTKKLVVSK